MAGSFIWYELLTSDPDAAQRFYGEVVGWSFMPFDASGAMDYRIFSAPDGAIGGLARSPDPAMKPGWFGYIDVDDVDATVAAIEAAGGSVRMPATDIHQVGRIAMLADPDGLLFYIMKPAQGGTSGAFSYTAVGHCSWNELIAGDLTRALDFYLGLFGWTKGDVMPMGPMGDYQFVHDARERIGGIMQSGAGWPTRWTYYFRVADIDAAAERVKAAGGSVTQGPMEVPGGDWVVLGVDPQGAAFALVGVRR